ncbi:hypothetical protein BKA82DRAFT_4361147 [Pisolithus tinctorius]|nr:hypothetical protein BKA82DRAFT_4361147 [Pisolithus tinctorius]
MPLGYGVEVDESVATAGTAHGTTRGQWSHGDASSSEQPIHKHIVEGIIQSIDMMGNFEDRLANESGIEGRGTWIAVKLPMILPRAKSLRNFSVQLVHTRPELSDPVLYPGTPDSSDLAILDRQPCRHSVSPLMEEDEPRIKIVIDVEYT